ncbi:hypothetical protein [Ruminococcus sp.]|uniref:hypothetical protein n=1 Tax=Ruminococcus sp. TaxID=41978 RepID=UPI0039A0B607
MAVKSNQDHDEQQIDEPYVSTQQSLGDMKIMTTIPSHSKLKDRLRDKLKGKQQLQQLPLMYSLR